MLRALCALLGLTSAAIAAKFELSPKKFLTLPLGDIKPAGWLHDQLQVQTDGLAGHMHEFYDLVSKSDWIGGDSYYSYLEEAGSYWFNAMVPNGVLMNNSIINEKTQEFLEYVLENQDATGWLGPEVDTEKPRCLWGRYPFFFGAIQMVEYKPELTARVVDALHKFVKLANRMLRNGEGVDKWAATRWEDFVLTLQWLHDFHPRGEEELLVDTMVRLKWSGVPWEEVFSEEYFPTGPVENLTNPFGLELSWHGVNMAEGFKALPATYRFTHNQSDIDAANLSWDLMFKYHGRPSGAYAADEMLAGLEAVRGTELCLVVEAMFSGSYLYQVIGDLKYADRVERMTYNALPATLTANMWGRQYLQQQNQVAAQNMSPNPFPEDGPYSNVFGLEPNYPCCTVNFPQGWPKFITNAFLVTSDKKGLVQLYLGPFEVQTTLNEDNLVKVSVETFYPFGDNLNITITATKSYMHYIRVPSWIVGGSMTVNDGEKTGLVPDEVTGLLSVTIGKGLTKIALHYPAKIVIEERPHGSIAVHRGPLNYAFDIPRSEKIIAQDPREPHAVDLQMGPIGAWEYALDADPATMSFHNEAENDDHYKLPSPIFDSGKPSVSIAVSACSIEWPLAGDMFVTSPPENPECLGDVKTIQLVPFGATKLRISEFPVFAHSEPSLRVGNSYQIGDDSEPVQKPFNPTKPN
ncbi:hypothetical protein GYMLUDRAFT_40596 [Collybiopsis luxurians FD-317 M1]|uniref:Non-reducing end beta-L-arabinofuranosidase-like GH127 catalytic domain-containing protein n=1 Tax=Collybiopsis luxurians FD-317 M1 TaxID=944289 RepID=A0A0D0D2W6_9AGAR|nr:hypothetical protein GYMLUDRAFT_40596 [Collybiopsis luxurians FD-317 M1]